MSWILRRLHAALFVTEGSEITGVCICCLETTWRGQAKWLQLKAYLLELTDI